MPPSITIMVSSRRTSPVFSKDQNATAPAFGTLKIVQVLETSAPQTVTVNGASVTVPALAPTLNTCALPTTSDANPVIPAQPANCAQLPGAVPMAANSPPTQPKPASYRQPKT